MFVSCATDPCNVPSGRPSHRRCLITYLQLMNRGFPTLIAWRCIPAMWWNFLVWSGSVLLMYLEPHSWNPCSSSLKIIPAFFNPARPLQEFTFWSFRLQFFPFSLSWPSSYLSQHKIICSFVTWTLNTMRLFPHESKLIWKYSAWAYI
jgi:hypothetical protein